MKKLKTFLLVLVAFSLLSLPCWSESPSVEKEEEITLTMEEFQFLKNSVENLKTISEQKNSYITTLEMSLIESKNETKKKNLKVGIISFSVGLGVGALATGLIIAFSK